MPKRSKSSVPARPAPRLVTKTERWLNLLAFLLDHRAPVTRDEIYAGVEDYRAQWQTGDETTLESLRRKFERDKHELRALGITIEPDRRRIQAGPEEQEIDAYRLRPADLYLPYLELCGRGPARPRTYALPSLTLKPEEFQTLRRAAERVLELGETAFGASAASALRKLSFDLPGVDPGEGDISISGAVPEGFEQVFAVLRTAVEQRRPVSCRYYSIGRDDDRERLLEPYGLMLSWCTWYCVARARDRNAIRVFRVSRMRDAARLANEPAFVVPDDFSIRTYLDRAPWELSDRPAVPTRVRIAFPHSRWVLAEGLGEVLDAADGAGGAVLEFQVRTVEPFVRWLLPFGTQAEVLDPSEIRDRVAGERDRLRNIYR